MLSPLRLVALLLLTSCVEGTETSAPPPPFTIPSGDRVAAPGGADGRAEGDGAVDQRARRDGRGDEQARLDQLPRLQADRAPMDGPCLASDLDGDGYGTAPSCDPVDCDDGNPSIHPASYEACNRVDDDCDGRIDEALGTQRCGVGGCAREAPLCVDGQLASCAPGAPEEERCDGVDNDCDGQSDEEAGAPCGIGACAQVSACVDGALQACVPLAPTEEVCDGVDNDCDGQTDEGSRAETVQAPYAELATFHPLCDGSTERQGSNCNAAFHRFCSARACSSTGFGPIENSGGDAWAICVAGVRIEEVSFAELQAQHPGCTGPAEEGSGPCLAAVHRHCNRVLGARTGFGSLELTADRMVLFCIESDEQVAVLETRYSALSALHGPCDGSRERHGRNCNAAIKRWCREEGFIGGFGPLENSGDLVVVACLRR